MSYLALLCVYLILLGCVYPFCTWSKEKREFVFPFDLFFNEYWRRSFDFTGKTKRKDFWLAIIQAFLFYFFLIGVPVTIYVWYQLYNAINDLTVIDSLSRNISFLSWFGAIINFVPGISIQIRRLRDIGKEPAWVLLTFIPFISLILLFWYAKSSFKSQFRLSSDKGLDLISLVGSDICNPDYS